MYGLVNVRIAYLQDFSTSNPYISKTSGNSVIDVWLSVMTVLFPCHFSSCMSRDHTEHVMELIN